MIAGIELSTWLIVALTAAAAGLVRGFAGFGAGMILSPVFAAFLGPLTGVPLLAALDGLLQLWIVPANFKRIRWREALFFAVVAGLTMPLGLWLLKAAPALLMTLFIAALALSCGLLIASGWRYRGPRNRVTDAAVAGVAGVCSGATSLSGPPLIVYSMASGDSAERVRARINGFFVFTSAIGLVLFTVGGLLGPNVWLLALTLLPIYMGGTALGHFLFPYASERKFKTIAVLLILTAGIGAVARAVLG